jgi:hypothetical protein
LDKQCADFSEKWGCAEEKWISFQPVSGRDRNNSRALTKLCQHYFLCMTRAVVSIISVIENRGGIPISPGMAATASS